MSWFKTEKITSTVYLTTEPHFFEGNRCNIWLIKGPSHDVVIDCGLGVNNLRQHLEDEGLIDPAGGSRPCTVVCTHVHFDHSGGASDFEHVLIHNKEVEALRTGDEKHTLNWVMANHFYKKPYDGFQASKYKVPPTPCSGLSEGDKVELGEGQNLDVLHLPGHTIGSIALYHSTEGNLFVGDVVYECGHGSGFLDWLPTSSVNEYITSTQRLAEFLETHDVKSVYPGHFNILTPVRCRELLHEYHSSKNSALSKCCMKAMKGMATLYFKCR